MLVRASLVSFSALVGICASISAEGQVERLSRLRRDINLDDYRMTRTSTYTRPSSEKLGLAKRAEGAPNLDEASIVQLAEQVVGNVAPGATYRLVDNFESGGIVHCYFKQTHQDLDIENANMNVNVSRLSTSCI